jgi:hypothetical protein
MTAFIAALLAGSESSVDSLEPRFRQESRPAPVADAIARKGQMSPLHLGEAAAEVGDRLPPGSDLLAIARCVDC